MDNIIQVNNIHFSYANGSDVLYNDFSLSICDNSVVSILGGSGSGKSTLAQIIAGIIPCKKGDVIRSENLSRPADLIYIDQNAMNSIFPWQNVRKNLEYPLNKLKWETDKIQQRCDYLLQLFHLQHLENSFPANLSGGELQRLALARSFSWQPKLAILDESFSALDQQLRTEIIGDLREIIQHDKMTVIFITHNIQEALSLATRCIVLGKRPVNIIDDIDLTAIGMTKEIAQTKLLGAIKDGYL